MSNSALAFAGGVLIGKITNWISSVIITGITLFYFKPEIYTYDTILSLKNQTSELLLNLTKQ